jgi:hypothetical protein
MTQDAVLVDFHRRRLGNMLERREGNPPEMLQDAVSMDFRRWKLGNIPEQWEGNPPGMTQDAVSVDFRRRKLGNMPGQWEGNPPGMTQDAVFCGFPSAETREYAGTAGGKSTWNDCRMPFSWISVGGDSGICWDGGREIHLE